MSRQMRKTLRFRLERERHRLHQAAEQLRRHGLGQALKESTGELSSYDQHTSDLGTETFARGQDLALRERVLITLDEVEQALQRLDAGTYGRCQVCGRFIGEERLLALPHARRCAGCQRVHDHQEQERRIESRPPGKRPLEEAALSPPFGRSGQYGAGDPGLQAEDIWQMVARYGNANGPQDVTGAVDYDETWPSADTEEPGGVEEVEFVADVEGTGVVNLEKTYPEPSGAGRRRPRPAEQEAEP